MDVLAHDAERTGLWFPCFQADDDVMPARIWCLSNVGAAGVCLGMGVAMSAPDDFQALSFRSQFGAQMLFRVNRVHHRTVSDVGTGHKTNNLRCCGMTHEQATHFFGIAGNAVRSHCRRCFFGHGNEVLG